MTPPIKTFACHNSTDQYAIIIDGRLGLYALRSDAERVYALIGGVDGGDGLAETPFGSCQMLPPHYKCTGCYHDSHDDVANHVSNAINVGTYIRRLLRS